ncbi:MAG: hypothetical protein ABFS34_03915 [Gemmatimonadota bacterium]
MLAALSCAESTSIQDPADLWDLGEIGPSLSVIPALPAVCSEITGTALIADEVVPVGTVEVSNDEANLYVVYRTSAAWPILNTAVFVGDSPADIPVNKKGNPRVGKFPFKSAHGPGTMEVVWEIPLTEVSGFDAVIAAFAQVGESAEGAWGAGTAIVENGNWSTFFTHTVAECAAETIDSDGGTITSPDGLATLTIPAGALLAPVDITIVPATREDLDGHGSASIVETTSSIDPSPNVSGFSANLVIDPLEPINGVTPIAETIWDLGPDGQQFEEPILVTLGYDEADLPAGFDENLLGLFVINGVFPAPPPPHVDAVANTVSAEIDHFSFVFVGAELLPAADLRVHPLAESADTIELGESVTYTATLSNLGPEAISDGMVHYQAFGSVIAGPISAGCTEEPFPIFPTVQIDCDVGAVASGGSVAAPAAVFVPQAKGVLEVWVDPSSAGSIDLDNSNNRATGDYTVVDPVADLEILNVSDDPDPAAVGEDIVYSISVGTPPSTKQALEGATLLLGPIGDATFQSASDSTCFGTILGATCPLPTLTPGLVHDVQITMRPDSGVSELLATMKVQVPLGTVDPDLANNTLLESTSIGVPATADLSVSDVSESADPIELGETITYQATVYNLGPEDAPDAGVAYQVFGNVVAGALNPGCVDVFAPFPSDVRIDCTIGPLAGQDLTYVQAAAFVPQDTGTFTVWLDPLGGGSVDPNLANNRLTQTFTVVQPVADLEILDIRDNPDPAAVGEDIVYTITLGTAPSTKQPLEGATLLLNPLGDATFQSASDSTCFGTVLGATCPLPTLPAGLVHEVQITMRPNSGVTNLTVNATANVPFGTVDPDPSNDFMLETTTIGGSGGADLAVISAIKFADPIQLGEQLIIQATVQNFGPDDAPNAGVAYQLFGNVVAAAAQPGGCTVTAAPAVADAEVVCKIANITGPGVSAVPSAIFEPLETGTFAIWLDPVSDAADPNTANNRLTDSITVTGPQADLSIDLFTDNADPVTPGSVVTYNVNVGVSGASARVDGAVLRILFTGDAVLFSSTASCTEIAGGIACPLGSMTTGRAVNVDMTLPTPSQTVTAEATVVVPAGLTDPDLSNNTRIETTTVTVGGSVAISVGDVIEDLLPAFPLVDTYEFSGTAGQLARIHLSLLDGSSGTAQLILFSPGDSIFPVGLEGRATDNSSANHVVELPASGTYRLVVDPNGTGPYRVGLGTGEGRLDTAFGPTGQGFVKGPAASSPANPFLQMQVVGDDVVIVGETVLTRYDANGNPAAGFGSSGVVDLTTALGSVRGQAVRVQPDGKIVVAASSFTFPYPWVIARFDASGALDPTFDSDGIVQVQLGTRSSSRPLGIGFVQDGPDLDIIVGGNAGDFGQPVGIARLNPDGSLDAGFGIGGTVFESGGISPLKVDVQPDGGILLASLNSILRYTSAGALDAGFAVAGRLDVANRIEGLRTLPGGDILVLGESSGDAYVMRLNPNGTQDGAFAGGGFAAYDFGQPDRFIGAAQDASGDLLVVGRQQTPGFDFEFLVVKMSSAGVLDPNFGHGGYLLQQEVDEARAVGFDTLGRILVGGQRLGSVKSLELTRHLPN